jgi:hypothetical protein
MSTWVVCLRSIRKGKFIAFFIVKTTISDPHEIGRVIDYYGVTFDHLVPADDPNPEVLQINIIEIGDDHGIYANQWLLFAVDPEEFIGKKVLAVPRCCQKRKGTQDRWRVNASVDQRVNGYEQLKGPEDFERYLKT